MSTAQTACSSAVRRLWHRSTLGQDTDLKLRLREKYSARSLVHYKVSSASQGLDYIKEMHHCVLDLTSIRH